ncbi:transcriptional attenuator, LytR family [Lachnospiraceae bacterium RM5]|nr:transcriptional attenuator, LytR family [Lachnospiraceae bacterium RM5]
MSDQNNKDESFEVIDLEQVVNDEANRRHRRHHSKRGKHRHHKSHKHKKKMTWKKRLLIVLCVIASLFLAMALFVFILVSKGKKSLFDRGKNPNLTLQSDDSVNKTSDWHDDWISHNGKVYEYKENVLTFYIMGIDKKTDSDISSINMGQCDANFLVVLDTDSKKMSVLCVNRDSMIDLDVYDLGGSYVETKQGQLALQHAYGRTPEESAEHQIDAISDLFYGIPINGYVALDLDSIAVLNDAVGGVTVTCNEDLTFNNPKLYEGARLTLSGSDAYDYLQDRTKTYEGARRRLARQKAYIDAYVPMVKNSIKSDLTWVVDTYNVVKPYMNTNLSIDEVSYLASIAKDYSFDVNNIENIEGETKQGERFEEFYVDKDNLEETILKIFYKEVDI